MKKLRLFIVMLMAALLPLAVQGQVSLPYEYGFENNDLTADGWTKVNCDASSAINNVSANSGTYSFRFHWTNTPPQYLISPELTGTDGGLEVAFSYKSSSTTFPETFKVGYSTTTNDIASFTWEEEIEEPYGTWTLYSNTFPAGTKYIAIQCTSDNQFYFYVDDFTFTATNGCTKPTNLSYSNLTATSIDLSWTAGGSETEWTLEVNGAEMTGITENPYTLTTTANTNYTVKVKANCSETDESTWSTPTTFTTPCDAVATVEEDFETYTSGLPDCWTKIGTGTVAVQTSQPNSGTKSLKFSGTTGNNVVALPALENYAGMYLTFSTKPEDNSSSSCGTFAVGYVTSDSNIFHALETYRYNDTYFDGNVYAEMGINVASVPANARLAFNHMSGSSVYYWFVDDVTVGQAPPCMAPNGLSFSNVTATSANLAWTANNDETEWTLEVNGEEMTGITENPYTLTTTANTNYTVKVKANCSETDESTWSAPVTFTTPCGTVATVEEDFETYTSGLPDCWTKIGTGTVAVQTSQPNPGTKSLKFSGTTGNNVVALPTLENYAGMYLTFSTKPESNSYSSCGTFAVGYVTSDSNIFHALETYSYNDTYFDGNVYAEMGINVSSVPANARLAFNHMSGASNYYWFVDDVTVGEAPPCMAPNGLSVSNVTATSANLVWTANNDETEWTLEVNGEEMTGITENPYTLTTTANTNYTVKVKANCTETDESDWSATLTFTTPCAAVATVEEDFETYTSGLPDCWTKIGAGTVAVQTSQPNSGTKSLKFSGTTGNNIVVLPAIENYAGLYLTFSTKPESISSSCGTFAVGYVTSDSNIFHALETYRYNDTYFNGDVYAEMNIDVSNVPANARLAFNHMSGSSYYYWFVDDVNVATPPTCLKPVDVTVSALTNNSATIAWTDNNETAPQSWTIEMNGVDTVVTENPFTFDNLTPATTYTVKVKANCTDEDESVWSAEEAFATDCETIVVTAANPYQEGFENEGLCWSIEQVAGEEGWYTYESSNSYEGATMVVCHYDPESESRLVSPVFDITQLTNPTFTFQHHQAAYYDIVDDLLVYYRTNSNEEWTLLAEYNTEYADWTMETFVLPNPTATYQVAFLGHGNDGNFIWVDDIHIFDDVEAPCATPTNVAVNNNVVTWTGDAANYNVQITVAGEVVIDTTVSTTTYTAEGLEDGTYASVTVQAVCAEDNLSEWSEAVEFDYYVGIKNYSFKANVYPNPTTDNVTVESDAINADITVYDAFGKLMMTSKITAERTILNFNEFAPGIYMVRIANNTDITTIKVVKK